MTDSLTITIIVIILTAIVGAFIKGRTKDKCLLSYANDLVTLLKTDGKAIWGRLHVESTGLEFRYVKEHQDADGHLETSYILYRHEYPSIQTVLRFHDELDEQCQKDRKRELEKIYHPTFLRRTNRKIANFFKTIRDSVMEVVNLVMDQAKKGGPAGAFLSSKDKYISQVKTEMAGAISTAFEPLYERHIGAKVVLEMDRDGKNHEYCGILKDYTSEFIEVMDVNFELDDKSPARLADIIVPRKAGQIRHMAE